MKYGKISINMKLHHMNIDEKCYDYVHEKVTGRIKCLSRKERLVMKRKILALMLTTAMVATCLIGCGDKGEEVSGGADSATEEGGSGEKVTLTFSHLFVEGESFHDLIPPSVEKFNTDHPEYEIIIEEMPQDAYLTQTNARGTADDLAELVFGGKIL